MNWDHGRDLFAVDGALRDLVVFDATQDNWRGLFAVLRELGGAATWEVGGEPSPSLTAEQAFAHDGPVLMRVPLGPVRLHCWFLGVDVIEMDFDPADVVDNRAFQLVLTLMSRLGDRLGLAVHLADEGLRVHRRPLLTYRPERREFVPRATG